MAGVVKSMSSVFLGWKRKEETFFGQQYILGMAIIKASRLYSFIPKVGEKDTSPQNYALFVSAKWLGMAYSDEQRYSQSLTGIGT